MTVKGKKSRSGLPCFAATTLAITVVPPYVATTDESTTNDDVITITGATDGDGGIGTTLKFVNMTGTANGWAAYVVVEGRDDNDAAATCAFSAA